MAGFAETEVDMEMMRETMEMKEAVISYLDRSGGLARLVRDCEAFGGSQQTEAICRFCVSVRPSEVMDTDARLGDCVLHRPLQATALFQSVCFLAIKTLSLIKKIHTENQVNVVLRLVNLPPLPGYSLDLCEFPRGYGPMRPLLVEGLVVAMTRITKYTQGARFLCTEATCPCSTGFHHIRVHAPGATESATVRSDFTCKLCSSPLVEDVKFRVLGDKQLVEVIHASAVDVLGVQPPCSVRFQSVTLFLRDELCNSMKIGRLYRVVGIPAYVHQWPHVIWSVEASSIQPWGPKRSGIVSGNFRSLLAATACSPWRFSAVVSNMFGSPVVPPGYFSTLKLCLLLSLVQTEGDDAHPFHHLDVLALTNDSLVIDRLMTYGLGLASRGIRHQVTREIQASLSEDAHGAGTANIHGGDALLASGGICLLGDLAIYRKDKIDALQSALETRTATVFIPGKKYGEDACQQLSFQIQCNFWALDDVATPTKRVFKGNSGVVGSVEMGLVPAQIAEAFGLVIQCRSDRYQFPLTIHTLRQAVTPGEPLYPACMQFTTQDYQELLAYARGLQVELSPQAEKMIHGYYMASRRVRSMLSVTSLRLLISLAEAHSKLSLRTKVLQEDAVLAVLLCEATLTLKYGASALVLPPDALFPCALHDVESLHRRDVALQQLQQQILKFVYSYAPDSTSYTAKE
ncbi:minichromosome maintenance domain-containing protein 2 [Scleropages formosus]|uniref:minichromosome maintenance domain-containing protein 2 n=1 Tax=Scleropages formosus TaxID=113540 RepID=UPI0010FAB37A|nr:minichromosome maintenance domain-containing protein 2 [Scleropages formosus]